MFNKNQNKIINEVGREGLSLKVAASQLGMPYSKFIEEFMEDDEAQLSYEIGQSELEVSVVTIAKAGMGDGDPKKFQFFIDNVLNMNKNQIKLSNSIGVVPPILLNTLDILLLDDVALYKEIMDEEAKKESGVILKDDNIDDNTDNII